MKKTVVIFLTLFLLISFSNVLNAKKLTLVGIGNAGFSAADVKNFFAKFGIEVKLKKDFSELNKALFLMMMIDYFFNPYGYNSDSEKYTRMDVNLYGAKGKRVNDKILLKYGGGPCLSFSHNHYSYLGKEMNSNKTNLGIGGMVRGEYKLTDKLSADFELGAKHIFVKDGATYITFSSGLVYIFSNN